MEEKKKIKKPMPPVLDNLTRYNDMKIEQELESKSSERLDTLRYNHLLSKTNQSLNGEELTYDYGYDMDCFEDHPCRCGSKNCIGYIVRSNLRWRVEKKLKDKKKKK